MRKYLENVEVETEVPADHPEQVENDEYVRMREFIAKKWYDDL